MTQQTDTLTPPTGTINVPAISSDALKVIGRKHPGRWVTVVIIAFIVFGIIKWAVGNENFRWDVFGQYVFSAPILRGLGNTIMLSVLAECMALILGTILAIMRLSENRVISGSAFAYSWFFRGLPLIVLMLFLYFGGAVMPQIILGVPFTDIKFFQMDTNNLISTPFMAALIGIGLNDAAYAAEIVRAGIMSVPHGQAEAAHALGMSPTKTMFRIVLPQALRIIIPPVGNAFIAMLKLTSMATFVGFPELMNTVSTIYSQNFLNIPLLLVASFWYLVLTTALSIGQHFVERHYGRGF